MARTAAKPTKRATPATPARPGPARTPLTRDRIVRLALAVADAEGLEAASFRRLAADLRVTPMALYRHVRDRADLLDAVTDVIFERIDLESASDPALPWSDALRRLL